MPYPNEHACRLKAPNYDKYARKRCEQKHNGKCIDVIYGINSAGKSEIQALRYKKDVWTVGTARAHCKSREGILFEPAKKKKEESAMDLTRILTKSAGGDFEEQFFSTKQLQDWFVKNSDEEGAVIKDIVLFEKAEFITEKADDGKEGRIRMVMSDSSLDRTFERVDQSGWKLKNYKKNPVILWAHNSYQPAIGIMEKVGVVDGKLIGYPKFDSQEIDQFAWMIGEKVRIGTIRGGSIGYKVLKIEILEDAKDKTRYILKELELLEFSFCNVPTLPSALVTKEGVEDKSEIDFLKKEIEDSSKKSLEREKEISDRIDGMMEKIKEETEARAKELEDLKAELLASKSKNVDNLFKNNEKRDDQTSDPKDHKINDPNTAGDPKTKGLEEMLNG